MFLITLWKTLCCFCCTDRWQDVIVFGSGTFNLFNVMSKQHYRSAFDLFLHEIKNINVESKCKRCLTIWICCWLFPNKWIVSWWPNIWTSLTFGSQWWYTNGNYISFTLNSNDFYLVEYSCSDDTLITCSSAVKSSIGNYATHSWRQNEALSLSLKRAFRLSTNEYPQIIIHVSTSITRDLSMVSTRAVGTM